MGEEKLYVAVIGGSSCSSREADQAAEVGRLLALAGVVLICGGRGGIMEAASKGCKEAGGLVVGILPGVQHAQGNPYLSVAIPTGLGHARNAIVTLAGHAVIAIGGGPGTLSEMGLALAHGRPVISLESWDAKDACGVELPIMHAGDPAEAVRLTLAVLR